MGERRSKYTRREFIQIGLGVAAGAPLVLSSACGGSPSQTVTPPDNTPPRADAKVAIVRCTTYGSEVQTSLSQAFDLLTGIPQLVRGKVVTVKVNLTMGGTFPDLFGRPATESYITHGATAIALASLLLSYGASKVRFVDSVGVAQPMSQILTMAGWDVTTLLGLGNVELENTRNLGSGTQYGQLNVSGGGYLFSYFKVNHCYSDTDVFVSLAKLKQHLTAGVTLTTKNVFGMTPNSLYGADAPSEDGLPNRLKLMHGQGISGWGSAPPPGAKTSIDPGNDPSARIPRIVADVAAARPIHLAIIDGITSMSGGEGPWATNTAPIAPGLLIAGLNPISTDAVGTAVMGYSNPRATRGTQPFQTSDNHLLLAESAGVGSADLSKISVLGLTIDQAKCPYPRL